MSIVSWYNCQHSPLWHALKVADDYAPVEIVCWIWNTVSHDLFNLAIRCVGLKWNILVHLSNLCSCLSLSWCFGFCCRWYNWWSFCYSRKCFYHHWYFCSCGWFWYFVRGSRINRFFYLVSCRNFCFLITNAFYYDIRSNNLICTIFFWSMENQINRICCR